MQCWMYSLAVLIARSSNTSKQTLIDSHPGRAACPDEARLLPGVRALGPGPQAALGCTAAAQASLGASCLHCPFLAASPSPSSGHLTPPCSLPDLCLHSIRSPRPSPTSFLILSNPESLLADFILYPAHKQLEKAEEKMSGFLVKYSPAR